jgi:hypothetical protein
VLARVGQSGSFTHNIYVLLCRRRLCWTRSSFSLSSVSSILLGNRRIHCWVWLVQGRSIDQRRGFPLVSNGICCRSYSVSYLGGVVQQNTPSSDLSWPLVDFYFYFYFYSSILSIFFPSLFLYFVVLDKNNKNRLVEGTRKAYLTRDTAVLVQVRATTRTRREACKCSTMRLREILHLLGKTAVSRQSWLS